MNDPDRIAHDEPSEPPPSPRAFALTLAAASLFLAYYLRRRGVSAPQLYIPPAVGAALLLASLVLPGPVTHLARGWAWVGKTLGKVTTPVLLTLVFALVLVPMRLVLTLVGRDPLARKPDRAARSYWSTRDRSVFSPADFERLS